MQVSVESTDGLERKLSIAVPAQQIDTEVTKRIADAVKKVRIDGFRPGKVPRKVVKQRFGDSIRAEVLGEVANQMFQQAVQQEELNPVGQPSIEPKVNEEGQDFEFIATFEIYPVVELTDAKTFELELLTASVADDDVVEMIAKLRDQQATWNEVERAAVVNDKLNIDYAGTKDGEAFEGGTAEGSDLELGSKRMIEGFESGLEGASAGDSITLHLTFPDEYHAEELKGAAVVFDVKVNSVSEKVLAELDAEFFAKFDVEGDIDDFNENVKENMMRQLDASLESHRKQLVMDTLFDQNTFDLPLAMIDSEIANLQQQSLAQFGAAAENFDLSMLPRELFEEQAKKRVALGVILNQAIVDFEIKPDRDALMAFLDDLVKSYDDPEDVKQHYLSDQSRLQQVEMMLIEKRVVDAVLDAATVTEKASSYQDVMDAAQANQG
jgi:trigger factor|tara:strand:+ start:547 stop:1860 length:1314 start_codon:yes stop_codon:yes gene_type:complete